MLLTFVLGIAMAVLAPAPAGPATPIECEELVRRVLDEVASRHHDPAVREAAERSDGVARESCAGRPQVRVAVERALARFDDPAIRLLDAAHFERMVAEWSGAPVVGVGLAEVLSIDVDETTRRLTVVAPVPGSPVSAAGLRTGDVVTEIDGAATDSLGLTRSMKRLRGERGATVGLEVLRNDRSRYVTLGVVGLPELEPVDAERRRVAGVDLLVVELRRFSPGVADELRAAVESVEGTEAIVLDLRNNPGGYVDELVGAASVFLEPGSEIARLSGPEPDTLLTRGDRAPVELPLAVVVDGGTASAAEALAAALQFHRRARVFGERTYGKGLAHGARPVEEDAWILMLPIGRLRTPAGRDVLAGGIDPDVRTENPLTQAARSLRGGSVRTGDP